MRVFATMVLATLLAACSADPCQELGEKICSCTGASKDSCKTQVEEDLKRHEMSDSTCDGYLATCNDAEAAKDGAAFCEWLLTENGKRACGMAN